MGSSISFSRIWLGFMTISGYSFYRVGTGFMLVGVWIHGSWAGFLRACLSLSLLCLQSAGFGLCLRRLGVVSTVWESVLWCLASLSAGLP